MVTQMLEAVEECIGWIDHHLEISQAMLVLLDSNRDGAVALTLVHYHHTAPLS
jgi:hypothetical protein